MAHIVEDKATNTIYLANDWHVDDVLNVRPDLTKGEAISVLELVADSFDANDGINWDVIEVCAEQLFPQEEDE